MQWCNKYLHENSWFLQCASLVLAKRIHFPTKSSWLLIAILQRLRSKEKVISDNYILLKWLSVEHACIFGSLNSVIKLSLFCCKERSVLKLFSRERKIRLFLPRRKILLNPYLCLQILRPSLPGLALLWYLSGGQIDGVAWFTSDQCASDLCSWGEY